MNDPPPPAAPPDKEGGDRSAMIPQEMAIQLLQSKDARIAAAEARKAGPPTWRQLRGVPLMMHEIKHVGNRPFAWGFA